VEHYTADYQTPNWGATDAARCALYLFVDTGGTSVLASGPDQAVHRLAIQRYAHAGQFAQDAAADLRKVWDAESALNFTFSQVTGVFNNGFATLVPRRMFDPANLPSYLRLLLRPEIGPLEYRFEPIPELDCLLVYAVSPDLLKTFTLKFPQGRITHQAVPLIKYWHRMSPAQDHGVFANIRWNRLQIAVFDHRNLLFYNTFPIEHPDDLLYYTLLAYEQFRIDPHSLPIHLSGDIDPAADACLNLRRCFKHIRFVSLPETVHLPAPFQTVPRHKLLDLFCHTV
jgi:hypothetical protein